MKYRSVLWLLLISLLLVPETGVAFGQDEDPPDDDSAITDDEVNAVARELYCPVCENVPLDVCPTQACKDWRAEIESLLEEGRTSDEIKAYFVERYGRRVLATPDAQGIDILLWALPVVAVLIGGSILAAAIWRMAPPNLGAPLLGDTLVISYDSLDPDYVERIERDLEEFK